MSEVQVKVLQATFEHFENELAGLLSEGWQVMHQETIYVDQYYPVEDATHQEPQLLAVLRRGGNEPLRGQGWMLSAIEGLQVQVQSMIAKLNTLDHVFSSPGGGGIAEDESEDLK